LNSPEDVYYEHENCLNGCAPSSRGRD
jgi:hypothetical protein